MYPDLSVRWDGIHISMKCVPQQTVCWMEEHATELWQLLVERDLCEEKCKRSVSYVSMDEQELHDTLDCELDCKGSFDESVVALKPPGVEEYLQYIRPRARDCLEC